MSKRKTRKEKRVDISSYWIGLDLIMTHFFTILTNLYRSKQILDRFDYDPCINLARFDMPV